MSRKAGISRTINYLFKDAKKLEQEEGKKAIIIRKNLRTRKLDNIVKEFEVNEALRKQKRKDAVKLYHTVISFHEKDSQHLDEKKLRDITKEYMRHRGENIYVATVHYDKGHQHIHIAESGTRYMTGLANRISKQQFRELKVSLQTFQEKKYPELKSSRVLHDKSKAQQQKTRIDDRQSHKLALLNLLTTAEQKSKNLNEFLSAIKAAGHEPYYRSEQLTGVKFEGETKFRFSRLGYDSEKLNQLNQQETEEQKQLEELDALRSQSNSRENEYSSRQREVAEEENPEQETDHAMDDEFEEDYSRD